MAVGDTCEFGFRYLFTEIGRMLGYRLIALQSRVRDQAWRDSALQVFYQRNENFEDIIHNTSTNERRAIPPSTNLQPIQLTCGLDVGSRFILANILAEDRCASKSTARGSRKGVDFFE
jgi:hypothetical protein